MLDSWNAQFACHSDGFAYTVHLEAKPAFAKKEIIDTNCIVQLKLTEVEIDM